MVLHQGTQHITCHLAEAQSMVTAGKVHKARRLNLWRTVSLDSQLAAGQTASSQSGVVTVPRKVLHRGSGSMVVGFGLPIK